MAPRQLPSFSYADIVALTAQLLETGKTINNQYMADVSGERTASAYQHRFRGVLRHAKLVVDNRKDGGTTGLKDLAPETVDADAGTATATPSKGKRQREGKAADESSKKRSKTVDSVHEDDDEAEEDKKKAVFKGEDEEEKDYGLEI